MQQEAFLKYRFVMLGIIITCITLEVLWNWRKQKRVYNRKETASNFAILVGTQFSKFFLLSWQLLVFGFFYQFRFFTIESSVYSFIALFFIVDFFYYWHHRALHEVKVLWTFHLVHHSSPWMNLTTSFRLNWFAPLISPFFYLPVCLLGFDPTFIIPIFSLNLFYQFWLHTEGIGKLGFLDKILNTPSNHRVHHGSNELYLDKNHGGFLMIWDRLFGTYQAETEKPVYGITTGFVGHNPFKLVFHGFVDYAKNQHKSIGRG
ncbi:MAG: sterol desaturase family protein [Spirochaetota bacterium]